MKQERYPDYGFHRVSIPKLKRAYARKDKRTLDRALDTAVRNHDLEDFVLPKQYSDSFKRDW